VVLGAGLPDAGAAVELPLVPRTDDVLAVEAALAQRSAGVVADAGDGAEDAVRMADRDRRAIDDDLPQRFRDEVRDRPEVTPARFSHGNLQERQLTPWTLPRGCRRRERTLVPLVRAIGRDVAGLDQAKGAVDPGAAVPRTGTRERAGALERRGALAGGHDRLAAFVAAPTADFLIAHDSPPPDTFPLRRDHVPAACKKTALVSCLGG